MEIFAFIGPGGVGKTTLAIHFALLLSKNAKVGVIGLNRKLYSVDNNEKTPLQITGFDLIDIHPSNLLKLQDYEYIVLDFIWDLHLFISTQNNDFLKKIRFFLVTTPEFPHHYELQLLIDFFNQRQLRIESIIVNRIPPENIIENCPICNTVSFNAAQILTEIQHIANYSLLDILYIETSYDNYDIQYSLKKLLLGIPMEV